MKLEEIPEIEDLPELATTEEAFAVLRVGRTKGYELIRQGKLPAVKLGRLIRIRRSELERLVLGDVEEESQIRLVK